ncbi:MAG: hypothetical protein J5J06_08400 [Phycisphaerae bacterium]|nr:hypothetical protein [Phycisphaerae bacterium]
MAGRFFLTRSALSAVLAMVLSGSVLAGELGARGPKSDPLARPTSLVLASQQDAGSSESTTMTTSTTTGASEWVIDGPVFLRSADPEPVGVLEIKNNFAWSTSKDGSDDDYEYELEVEYGLVENHELLLALPFELGDGEVDGNGDLTLGWHWRLWREDGWIPAFAVRNYLRFPTGYRSSGVDYELRGLFTKTLVTDLLRLHLNPFGRSVNGNNEEDAHDFFYGAALGVDYRVSPEFLLVADYLYTNGEDEGESNEHMAELGFDWELGGPHIFSFALDVSLDGDDEGEAFGAKLSYIYEIGE